jgi:hypothetical protein
MKKLYVAFIASLLIGCSGLLGMGKKGIRIPVMADEPGISTDTPVTEPVNTESQTRSDEAKPAEMSSRASTPGVGELFNLDIDTEDEDETGSEDETETNTEDEMASDASSNAQDQIAEVINTLPGQRPVNVHSIVGEIADENDAAIAEDDIVDENDSQILEPEMVKKLITENSVIKELPEFHYSVYFPRENSMMLHIFAGRIDQASTSAPVEPIATFTFTKTDGNLSCAFNGESKEVVDVLQRRFLRSKLIKFEPEELQESDVLAQENWDSIKKVAKGLLKGGIILSVVSGVAVGAYQNPSQAGYVIGSLICPKALITQAVIAAGYAGYKIVPMLKKALSYMLTVDSGDNFTL